MGQAREHSCDWSILQRVDGGYLAIDQLDPWGKRSERSVAPSCSKKEYQTHLLELDETLQLKKRTPLTCGLYAWQTVRDGKVLSIGMGESSPSGEERMSLGLFDGRKILKRQVADPSGTIPEALRKASIIGGDRIWIGSTHLSTDKSSKFTIHTLDHQLRTLSMRTVDLAPNLSAHVHVDAGGRGFWVRTPETAFLVAKDGSSKEHPWTAFEGAPSLAHGYVRTDGAVIAPDGTILGAPLEGTEKKDLLPRQFEPIEGAWSEGALAFTWWNGHVHLVPGRKKATPKGTIGE